MALVIDDALLLTVLAGRAPNELTEAMGTGDVFTTSSWYYRLGRAAQDRSFLGALSHALERLPATSRNRVIAGLDALPDEIGLPDMRELVPVMRRLDVGRQLNYLTAEAVALALVLQAGVRVTTESRLMNHACSALGLDIQIVQM